MSLGSYNNSEFIEIIKEILIELDLPEVLKIAKFKEIKETNDFNGSIETGTPRASEEIDCTEYQDFYDGEDNDDENILSYESIIYEDEEYNSDEDCEIMLSSELSFTSAYKLLNYIEKSGINVTLKMFRKHFDKWIKTYPDLKDLYKNVLSENNFSNVNKSYIKTKIFPESKEKKIKGFIDKIKTDQERLVLKSLEKLRLNK
jgi:hypothetical protein